MAEIKIIDGWSFEVDEQQLILIHEFKYEKRDFKTRQLTGEVAVKREEVGYFKTLAAMLERLTEILCKKKVDAGEITTIREYIAELRKIHAELKEICDFVGKQ